VELPEVRNESAEVVLGEALAAVERGEIQRLSQVLEDDHARIAILSEDRGHRGRDRGSGSDGPVERGLDAGASGGGGDRGILLDPGAGLLEDEAPLCHPQAESEVHVPFARLRDREERLPGLEPSAVPGIGLESTPIAGVHQEAARVGG
jgi:hypothetical protein